MTSSCAGPVSLPLMARPVSRAAETRLGWHLRVTRIGVEVTGVGCLCARARAPSRGQWLEVGQQRGRGHGRDVQPLLARFSTGAAAVPWTCLDTSGATSCCHDLGGCCWTPVDRGLRHHYTPRSAQAASGPPHEEPVPGPNVNRAKAASLSLGGRGDVTHLPPFTTPQGNELRSEAISTFIVF